MRVKLLKPIYLDKNYILEGTEIEAKEIEGDIIVSYQTCCSIGTRKLEFEEYIIMENDITT